MLPAPAYYGSTKQDNEKWILIEWLEGTDLRDFTEDMAHACAESICKIMNIYWQNEREEFEKKKIDVSKNFM